MYQALTQDFFFNLSLYIGVQYQINYNKSHVRQLQDLIYSIYIYFYELTNLIIVKTSSLNAIIFALNTCLFKSIIHSSYFLQTLLMIVYVCAYFVFIIVQSNTQLARTYSDYQRFHCVRYSGNSSVQLIDGASPIFYKENNLFSIYNLTSSHKE